MGSHLELVSDDFAKKWQKEHRRLEFLTRKNEPGSRTVSFIKYPLYGFNLPGKGETYLTSLLSGLIVFLKNSL